MRSYYDSTDRWMLLFNVVEGWLKTPFFFGGSSKEGADCGGAQLGVHIETGALEPFPIPRGVGTIADQLALARMSRFLSERPEFFMVDTPGVGDLMTGRIRNAGEYHIGTYLGTWHDECGAQGKAFVHCLPHYGVSISNLFNPTYSEKLVSVWRIKHEDDR